ncbi:YveK family protein, partial [Enterococcus durans]
YWLFITLLTVLGGLISIGLQYFTNDEYLSESKILVNLPQNEATTNADAISANQGMIDTYREIIKSDDFLEPIVSKFKDINIKDLKNDIQVEKAENSYVFNVKIQGSSETEVEKLGSEVAKNFEKSISEYVNVEKVKILSLDVDSLDSGKTITLIRFLIVGLLTGFCLSLGISLLREFIVFE